MEKARNNNKDAVKKNWFRSAQQTTDKVAKTGDGLLVFLPANLTRDLKLFGMQNCL